MLASLMLTQATSPVTDAAPKGVVVIGQRIPGAAIGPEPPLVTLHVADIRALGVDTVADVLKAIEGATRSGRGGEQPVLLLNGKRTSGPGEIQGLPAEAILRVDVFSEQEAVRYGYAPTQRVVNIVTLNIYRSTKVDLTGGTTTDGGDGQIKTGFAFTRIADSRRVNIGLTYEDKAAIREDQRGIASTAATGLYDSDGNVTGTTDGSIDPALDALAGQSVSVAGVPGPHPTLAGFAALAGGRSPATIGASRTLQPLTRKVDLNAVVTDRIFGSVFASLNASLGLAQTRGLQGPVPAILTVPATNPFSPFASDVLLYRYLTEAPPLEQTSRGVTAHVSANLNGMLGGWSWSITGRYERNNTRTTSERGIDLSGLQAAIDVGDASLDPFAPLPLKRLNLRLNDTGRSITSTATATAFLSGPAFRVPAGRAFASIALTGEMNRLESMSIQSGTVQAIAVPRDAVGAQMTLGLPITRRSPHVLAALGGIYANLNFGISKVARFRTLTSYGYGLSWSPFRPLSFNVAMNVEAVAPAAVQLVSPTITTPNVPTFDFMRGVTTLTTLIGGGNAGLSASHRRSLDLGVAIRPINSQQMFFNVNYVASASRGLVNTLPTATAAIESAFPDRFMRGPDRTLLSIDTRPINLDREDRSEISTALFFSRPVGEPAPPKGGGMGQSAEQGPEPSGRMILSLTHIWRFRDKVLLRLGVPVLDLLDGDVLGAAGGQPRHELKLDLSRNANGLGIRIGGSWQSGTRFNATDPASALHFSSLTRIDVKLFSDLDQLHGMGGRIWARQLRITFGIENLFARRLRVTNGLDQTPLGYQPAYLDPIGRFVSLSVRRLF